MQCKERMSPLISISMDGSNHLFSFYTLFDTFAFAPHLCAAECSFLWR